MDSEPDPRFGLPPFVLDKLVAKTGIKREDLEILFAYAVMCNYKKVAAAFPDMDVNKVADCVRVTLPHLFEWAKQQVRFHECIIKHPSNRISYLAENIIGSVDTVPIYVFAYPHGYQPKYQAYVVKFLVVVSHTGYILFVSDAYTGASNDGVIADHCLSSFLADKQWRLVGDGLFTSEEYEQLYDKTEIWPYFREDDQTIEQYIAQGHERQLHNAELTYVRSRVEHCFGAGQFGNFFTNIYAGSHDVLRQLMVCIAAATNIHTANSFGLGGKYSEVNLVGKIKSSFRGQQKRYGVNPEFYPPTRVEDKALGPQQPKKVERRKRFTDELQPVEQRTSDATNTIHVPERPKRTPSTKGPPHPKPPPKAATSGEAHSGFPRGAVYVEATAPHLADG